ncbi:hypothetical protein TB2_008222 [Malus domestica]
MFEIIAVQIECLLSKELCSFSCILNLPTGIHDLVKHGVPCRANCLHKQLCFAIYHLRRDIRFAAVNSSRIPRLWLPPGSTDHGSSLILQRCNWSRTP